MQNYTRQANFAEKTKKGGERRWRPSGMNDLFDMNVKSDDISLEDRVGMLNANQRRIFDKVKKPTTAWKPTALKQAVSV